MRTIASFISTLLTTERAKVREEERNNLAKMLKSIAGDISLYGKYGSIYRVKEDIIAVANALLSPSYDLLSSSYTERT